MARPPTWHTLIDAPAGAMELYALIARLQNSPDFQSCHVFNGTTLGQIPHIQRKGTVKNLPKILCGFMGLIYKRKMCQTTGCVNPLHYTAYSELMRTEETQGPVGVDLTSLEAYVETVRYYIEENDLRNPTFAELRPLIPEEDINDEVLRQALEQYELQSRNQSPDEL